MTRSDRYKYGAIAVVAGFVALGAALGSWSPLGRTGTVASRVADTLCVFNRSDDRLLGRALTKLARGGRDTVYQVRVDASLEADSGTTWAITVPRNGTVRSCPR